MFIRYSHFFWNEERLRGGPLSKKRKRKGERRRKVQINIFFSPMSWTTFKEEKNKREREEVANNASGVPYTLPVFHIHFQCSIDNNFKLELKCSQCAFVFQQVMKFEWKTLYLNDRLMCGGIINLIFKWTCIFSFIFIHHFCIFSNQKISKVVAAVVVVA